MSPPGREPPIAAHKVNVRFQAERKAGILLKERAMAKGGKPMQESYRSPEGTLSDIGISKKQSSQFQKLADIPEREAGKMMKGMKRAAVNQRNPDTRVSDHGEPIPSEFAKAKQDANISDSQAKRWQKTLQRFF